VDLIESTQRIGRSRILRYENCGFIGGAISTNNGYHGK
jgi:hypothetical protein